ncbi:MAG: hypothetical protein ACTSV2_17050 [Candidatus Thorarchaeota archaeon]
MKRVPPILITALFLAGIFITPAGVSHNPACLQETSILDNVTLERDAETTWLPPDKSIRIAVYSESNLTAPTYATGSGVLHDNSTGLRDILLLFGYDATLITTNEIYNHQLITANYDVFVMVDNYPRENITDQVTEFWKSGGSLISFGNAAGFLCYFGILPPEAASTSGHGVYWINSADAINVTARHPVSQDYQLNQTVVASPSVDLAWFWSALQGTSIAGDLTMVARSNNNPDYATVIAYDPSTIGGGKVVAFSTDNSGVTFPAIDDMIADAVEWVCPRPKARIAYDLTHRPDYGVDPYDAAYAQSSAITHLILREELVSRAYTFDKLYPSPLGNLTTSNLEQYDVLIVNNPQFAFTSQEETDVDNWISSGGSLLIIADHSVGENNNLNQLLTGTNMELNNTGASNVLSPTGTHITHESASTVLCAASGTVNYTAPAIPIWDDGAGNVVLAVQDYDSGRIAIIADNYPFRDSGMVAQDNGQVAINLVNWLSSAKSTVLAFIDENSIGEDPNDNPYRGPVAQALNELGVSWYYSGDDDYFNMSLYEYDWDLVIVEQFSTNMNFFWGDLLDYIKSGERLLIQSTQLNQMVDDAKPFRDYIGIAYTANVIYPSLPIHFWAGSSQILTTPRNYVASNVSTNSDYGFNSCWNVTIHSNATALGGISETKPGSGTNATIILGAGDNVLVNSMTLTAFTNDTDDSTYADNFEIWENEIAFMLRPRIDSPSDITIEVGSRGESITWTPSSYIPYSYTIVRNSYEINNSLWDGGSITLNLKEDNLGVVSFHITVYDTLGFYETDTVVVTKEDSIGPMFIDGPDNLQYEEGTGTHLINWSFTEIYPDSYVLYINGTPETSDDWDGSDISVNVGGLSQGVYNLTLAVNDTSGNLATSRVYLTVTEPVTTTTTTDTITDTTTTAPPPGDTSVVIIIVVVAGVIVIIIIIIVMKKKS